MDLATIVGPAYHNAGTPDAAPIRGPIVFTPVDLDEQEAPVDSTRPVRAYAVADGQLVREGGGPVRLWPGAWHVSLPDGDQWDTQVLAGGATYTLADLRGYTPPPAATVQTVQVPAGGQPGQVLTATEDGFEWVTPAVDVAYTDLGDTITI